MQWLKDNKGLIIILLLAAALRTSLLFFRGTLWFDELFSIHYSSLPWADAWRYWTLETNPPLYTFLLRFYLLLGDATNAFFTRFFAFFFSLATIAAVYLFAKKLFSEKAAIFSAVFLTVSGVHLIASTETRVYTLFGFLTIISYYLFYELFFEHKTTRKNWILYTLVTALLLWSHLTAVVIPLTHLLTLIVLNANKRTWKHWWASQFGAGILWLPWFIPALLSKFNSTTATGWFFDAQLFGHANLFSLVTTSFFVNNIGGQFIYTIVMLAIVVGIVFVGKRLTSRDVVQKEKHTLIYLLLWTGVPMVATSLFGIFVPKYTLFAYPAMHMLGGYVIDRVTKTQKQTLLALVASLVILFPSAYLISSTTVFSWDPFVNYVEENETDSSITLMAFPETLAFNHFYEGDRPAIGIYLAEDDLPYDERIVRFNWNKQLTDNEELTAWVNKQINDHNADKIFIIQNSISYSWIHEILLHQGWSIDNRIRAPGYTESYLLEFNGPKDSPTITQ